MKYYPNVRILTFARTAAGICLMAAVLLGNRSNAQSNPAATDAEELARLRAQVEALTKENEALKTSQQPARSEAPQPSLAAAPAPAPTTPSAPAAAERAIPVVTRRPAPSSSLSPTGEEVIQMEAMSVTGSNIKQLDVEKILPVTVISKDAMDLRNALTPAEMLIALPQVTGIPANETRSASQGARGDNSNINLRGLGASASLILLNGRRLAPHPMTTGLNVNVNQLPNQGISQIEVLRDGASAVYGSDAIAGVVNYIMRTDYRGTEIKTRLSTPELGFDGESAEVTITLGRDFAGGRGRFLTTLDVLYREAIWLRDTKVSDADHSALAPPPFNLPGGAFNSRATVGFWPTFKIGASAVTNYFYMRNGVPTLTPIAPTRAANPDFYYNINQDSMAMPRTRRENIFNRFEYDLTDRITAFADISGYKSDSVTVRQPISLNAPTSDLVAPMSVDNPFNPYGSRFYDVNGAVNSDGTPRIKGTPQAVSLTAELVMNLPPDRIIVSAGTYRVVAGLKGKLTDTWNWESAVLYSQTYAMDKAPNNVRESLFMAALQRTGVSPQADPRFAAEAGAMNPFGYTFKVQNGAVVADQVYKNPDSVMNTFMDVFRQDGRSFVGSVDARASGRLFTIWSGDINLALGGEFRKESFDWVRPYNESTRNDFYVSSPLPDNSGSRTVESFYSEIVVPLVAVKNDIPLVNTFEVSGSGRFERYNDFGSALKPKVGANYRPFSTVMLRASYNNGFTAPSLSDLYTPPSSTFASVPTQIDIYRNVATKEGPYVTQSLTSGNPNLKPSTSIGKTVGIAFDVPLIKGLSLSADYFQIAQHNITGSRLTNQIYISDDLLLRAYVQQQLAAGVKIMSIDTGSGTPSYKGDPYLIRYVPDVNDIAAFTAYNAANPNAPMAVVGHAAAVNAPLLNIAGAYVSGWDYGLHYVVPGNRFGRFTVSADASQLVRSFSVNSPPNATPVVTVRKGNSGNAVWRGNVALSWHKDKWSGGVSAYYIGNFTDTGASTTQALYEANGKPSYIRREFDGGTYVYRYIIKSTTTFNAFGTYNFGREGTRFWKPSAIRVGVTNLTNLLPPLSTGAFGYDVGTFGSLIAGRIWNLEVTKDF